jgi:YaiO family outer membrane protein
MPFNKPFNLLTALCFCCTFLMAQETDTTTSDGLLKAARTAAFDQDNYPLAKRYLYKAIAQSPDYADLRVFLGRIYTWTKNYDSAAYCFEEALKRTPGYEDASLAYADMTYWSDQYEKSLLVCDEALKVHPRSQDLLMKRARVLNALRRYKEAATAVNQVLALNKNNTEARTLAGRIRELSSKNRIGISYDYVTFDKQFADPWHLVSIDYGRTTGIGSIIGRINYANRFATGGYQYELEAYPRISKTFYTYVGAAYSDKIGVFPHWRGGFSLYANLPASYEAELGIRYLKFSGSPTWIYTAYVGKYYKSWLFGARTYITPSIYTSTVSSSYNLSARYYYGSADDMIGGNIGYGISPDDRFNAIQLNGTQQLTSYRAGLSFRKKVGRMNVFTADATWFNQEYLPKTIGNQYQFSVAWLYRF